MRKSLPSNACVDNLSDIVTAIGECVRKFFSIKIEECLIVSTNNEAFLDKDAYWKETQKRLREQTKTIQLEQWQLLCKELQVAADKIDFHHANRKFYK